MTEHNKKPWVLPLPIGPLPMRYCATKGCAAVFSAETGAIICGACAEVLLMTGKGVARQPLAKEAQA